MWSLQAVKSETDGKNIFQSRIDTSENLPNIKSMRTFQGR